MSVWADATVLITGGTGSFGQAFARRLLDERVRVVRILSRDEFKQSQGHQDDRLRYFIGDVRDADRLRRAFDGVDVVVHAAAMKQVPACEYNPWEAVRTNVIGTQNVIDAAIDGGVARVIMISTDKAAHPVNLYGATKLCAEKLLLAGAAYAGSKPTRFSVVRYGNVVGSRGSIVPLFLRQRGSGFITLTDERMTRFWLRLEDAVEFTKTSIERMTGGEVFVPRIPSVRVSDIARVVAPDARVDLTGIRPGEKLHETLITIDDQHVVSEATVRPYASDTNTEWVSLEEIAECTLSASSKLA